MNLEQVEDLEERVRLELNNWQVDLYAKNTYLHKIPEKRIWQKRDELRKKYNLI